MTYASVSKMIKNKPAPYRGVVVDIVEYPKSTFAFRLYRENLEQYSDGQKISIFEWIKDRLEMTQTLLVDYTIGLEIEDEVPDHV